MATIRIPPVLRASVGGEREVSADGSNVGEVLHALADAHPATAQQLFGDDLTSDQMTQPRRDALRRFARRGRPEWESTAPDHADEPPDLIWERERRRRGLG